jgi:hypothetical protein
MKALDEEITKAQLRKEIIKEEMSVQAKMAGSFIKPLSLGWQLVRMLTSADKSKTPSSVLLRVITEIISTVEASKSGVKLLKKIFR